MTTVFIVKIRKLLLVPCLPIQRTSQTTTLAFQVMVTEALVKGRSRIDETLPNHLYLAFRGLVRDFHRSRASRAPREPTSQSLPSQIFPSIRIPSPTITLAAGHHPSPHRDDFTQIDQTNHQCHQHLLCHFSTAVTASESPPRCLTWRKQTPT